MSANTETERDLILTCLRMFHAVLRVKELVNPHCASSTHTHTPTVSFTNTNAHAYTPFIQVSVPLYQGNIKLSRRA